MIRFFILIIYPEQKKYNAWLILLPVYPYKPPFLSNSYIQVICAADIEWPAVKNLNIFCSVSQAVRANLRKIRKIRDIIHICSPDLYTGDIIVKTDIKISKPIFKLPLPYRLDIPLKKLMTFFSKMLILASSV